MSGFNERDMGQAIYTLILNVLAREIHTCMPGRVESVYEQGGVRMVDVKPLLREARVDGSQKDFAVASGVLLMTIGTSASSIKMPVQKGDTVLLMYSERALEFWKLNTTIANSVYGRQFDLSDAFAIPFNFSALDASYNNEDVVVDHAGQNITIKANGDINVGSTSLKALVTNTIFQGFNEHVHLDPVSGISGTPVTAASVPIVWTDLANATQKVKAQ